MKFLHTMLRVGDLNKSIQFYTEKLGMKLLRSKEYPSGKFTLAFVGFEDAGPQIELTYNWDKDRYDVGTGFGHIAFGVNDIYQTCAQLKQQGVEITREPGPMKHGGSTIAFIKDPDGYMIELIQRG